MLGLPRSILFHLAVDSQTITMLITVARHALDDASRLDRQDGPQMVACLAFEASIRSVDQAARTESTVASQA